MRHVAALHFVAVAIAALASAVLLAGCAPDAPPPAYVASGMTPPGQHVASPAPDAAYLAGQLQDDAYSLEEEHLDAVAEGEALRDERAIDSLVASQRDMDCRDFSSHAEAQAFYEAHRPGDPHHLDFDRDGVACERLH